MIANIASVVFQNVQLPIQHTSGFGSTVVRGLSDSLVEVCTVPLVAMTQPPQAKNPGITERAILVQVEALDMVDGLRVSIGFSLLAPSLYSRNIKSLFLPEIWQWAVQRAASQHRDDRLGFEIKGASYRTQLLVGHRKASPFAISHVDVLQPAMRTQQTGRGRSTVFCSPIKSECLPAP